MPSQRGQCQKFVLLLLGCVTACAVSSGGSHMLAALQPQALAFNSTPRSSSSSWDITLQNMSLPESVTRASVLEPE